jgi:adenylate cyclase class 2
MAQNVELKCELRDPDRARELLRALGADPVAILDQTDTYYERADGRLKRRETRDHPTTWVFYRRDDAAPAVRLSRYELMDEAEASRRFGELTEPWVVVRKTRELWMHDCVRIHLDRVAGLGDFLEFEALVGPDRSREQAAHALAALETALAPALGPRRAGSYSDLVSATP